MERKRSSRRRRPAYEAPYTDKLKEYVRQFIAFMFSNIGIMGLVVGYTIGGAFMFIAIEAESARDLTADVLAKRGRTAARLWELTSTINVFNESAWSNNVALELSDYQNFIIKAVKNGYDGIDDPEESKQWRFSGAFLYALTVISTIGYGNIAPRTDWGKVVTIFYAIIGMPLFLLYLANIGDLLARSFKWTYSMCCLCRWCPGVAKRRAQRLREKNMRLKAVHHHTSQPVIDPHTGMVPPAVHVELYDRPDGVPVSLHEEETEEEESVYDEEYDPQSITVPITVCLAIIAGFVLFGATLFAKWESWDLIDGSYFCFISLSTIGFGDLVLGDKIYGLDEIDYSFIFCSTYLMLGMAIIAMCFNLMGEQVSHKFRVLKMTLRRIFRLDS